MTLSGNRVRVILGIPLISLVLLHRNYNLIQLSDFLTRPTTADTPPTTSTTNSAETSILPAPLAPAASSEEKTNNNVAARDSSITNNSKEGNDARHNIIKNVSLVVRMKGEMSNLISHLVFAKGIQWWAEEHYYNNMTMNLIGERQAGTKWKGAVSDLQMCFPNLRSFNFQGGRWDSDFRIRRQQQKEWVGDDNHKTHLTINRADSDCGETEWFCLHEQLAFLRQTLQQDIPESILAINSTTIGENSNTTNNNNNNNSYSLPFIASDQQASFDVLVDQYFFKIKEWLRFDYAACCSPEQPDPDEVVFHLRNFRAEMGERNYFQKGYEELTPQQAATELLGHLPPGSKIAIASRGDDYVQSYIDALTERGYHVRTTPASHTGVQDFCFLLQAQRELVGTMRSTYTRWAALLGKAERVQLYSMDSPWTRQAHGTPDHFPEGLHYQWRRPELQSKIHYRVFSNNTTTV